MAGFVNATIVQHVDRSFDVEPDVCPAADEHTNGPLRCYTVMFDGSRRSCPFWYGCTYIANASERSDVITLYDRMAELGALRSRCGVLCLRARANRKPGC